MTDKKTKSEANIKDLVDSLRKSVESSDAHLPTEEVTSSQSAESSDGLLDKLRENMGGATAGMTVDDFRENDYDISGYEITEVPAEEELMAPAGEEDVLTTVAVSEEEDTLPPWDFEESPQKETTPKASASVPHEPKPIIDVRAISTADDDEPAFLTESEQASLEISEDKTKPPLADVAEAVSAPPDTVPALSERLESPEEDEEDEKNEESAENEPKAAAEMEEAVRKQVELFVEKTVDPEEEFDYFAGLDRKTRGKVSLVENVSSEAVQEAEPLLSDPSTESDDDAAIGTNTEDEKAPLSTEDLADGEQEHDENEIASPSIYTKASDFFYPTSPAPQASENADPAKSRLDDTDINLLLALGQKEKLEESVGFVRVREAKNNFYDPADEEPIGRTFAYDGEEYRTHEQAEGIKTRYRKEKKNLYRRLVGTGLLAFLLFITEHITWLGVDIPYVSDFFASDIHRYLINLVLGGLCLLLSVRTLLNGARGFFTMRPNQHTPIAILSLVNLMYSAAVPLLLRDAGLSTYHFALSIFLLLSIVGDVLRLSKEMLTFDIISDEKEKFSLEKADDSPQVNREKKVLDKRDLLVERVSFVGKYFTRSSRRPAVYTQYFIELLIAHVIAIFSAILVAFLEKNIAQAINTFILVLFICIPIHYLIHGIYPLGRLSKLLYGNSSAIIGETVDTEYVGANTVYLDDIEMFGLHGVSVSGLRIYNDADFYKVLYHASAVFSRMEGPLRYVFENSAQEIEKAESVKILNIYANGIEALVDSHDKIFIGNVNFMRSNGFFPKRNEDDDKKVENGELCILYMTVNGSLCAKFYMKYTVTQRFEKFVAEMHENNTKVGIRTLDPNVTERMIALLRKDKEIEIAVIRPTLNDLVPLGRRSDSSIITAKNPHMIAKILAHCTQLKKIRRFNTWMRVVSMIFGGCAAAALVLTHLLTAVPSLYIAAYQLLWIIPSIIYINIKLK